MATHTASRHAARRSSGNARRAPSRKGRDRDDGQLSPVQGAERSEVAGVRIDAGAAGNARVRRMVYPPGFHWTVHMKPVAGTDLCMRTHVGYLERGEIRVEYPDGCSREFVAPAIVAIEPGHDATVPGKAAAVLIEFDLEGATDGFGLPALHRHV